MDYTDVDAVVISHMHADHFLDLIPLRYALRYGPLLPADRLALWLPPGGERLLRELTATLAGSSEGNFLDDVFEVREYHPEQRLEIDDIELRFAKTRHYIDAYAVRAERDGASFVYSADTAPCDSVEELARDCSLLLSEATLGLGTESDGARGHLSAVEAGDLAKRSRARRLLLTHYGSEFAGRELEDAAETVFPGPCAIADDGTEVSL